MKPICPPCCASLRTAQCGPCPHYAAGEEYRRSRARVYAKAGKKDSPIATDPRVEAEVDGALRKAEAGRFAEAEAILTPLLREHPRDPMVLYGMGVLFAKRERLDVALDFFNRAIEVFPYFFEAHFNKGMIHQRMLDIGNMIRSYRMVVELGDPEDEHVRHARGVLKKMGKSLREEHGVDLDVYLQGHDNFDKGVACMERREWEAALGHFEEVSRLLPRHVQGLGNMGICHMQMGRKARAMEAFDKALALDPGYEIAAVNRTITLNMEEGAPPQPEHIASVDYYKEYGGGKRSFIRDFMQHMLRNHPKEP
jgi:tetratricopeptide (TPR) repeat protein